MRKFIIAVAGEKFEVDVEEVSSDKVYSPSKISSVRNADSKTVGKDPVSLQKIGGLIIDSPMPGNILRIMVGIGDEVTKGQKLFVLESMKMENEIAAPASGRVSVISVNEGDAVTAGQHVIILE